MRLQPQMRRERRGRQSGSARARDCVGRMFLNQLVALRLALDLAIRSPFAPLQNIVSLACGAFHSAALTDRGHVLTWGCGIQGQLGHGDTRDVKEPRFVEALRAPQSGPAAPAAEPVFVSALVCGGSITAALSDEGGVWTWGSGSYGALGHNDVSDRLVPTRVSDLKGIEVQKLAAGDAHMFACTAREIYAWGWNQSSQCGLGHEEDQHRPHVIESLRGTEVREISAGATHSFALVHIAKMRSDILFSWGSNAMGQCGQGKKTKLARPTPIPELRTTGATGSSVDSPVVEVRCGANHTILRTSNGEVLATGSNRYGQCGLSASGSGKAGAGAGAGASHPLQVDEFHCVDFLKDKIARSLCCGGENSSVLTARAWVEDSEATECMACKAPFTFVNRKHHCRNCVRRQYATRANKRTQPQPRTTPVSTARLCTCCPCCARVSSSSACVSVVNRA